MGFNETQIAPHGIITGADHTTLPRDMTFNEDSLIAVVSYGILLLIGGAGNLAVFITLFRASQWRSRVNHFIMHLSLADMVVVFIMMPLEIGELYAAKTCLLRSFPLSY